MMERVLYIWRVATARSADAKIQGKKYGNFF